MKQAYIVILALLVVAIAIGLWRPDVPSGHASAPYDANESYNNEITVAADELAKTMTYTDPKDVKVKDVTYNLLKQCLHYCLVPGQAVAQIVKRDNCKPLCGCLVSKDVHEMPRETIKGGKYTAASIAKGKKLSEQCFSQYQ